MGDDTRRNPTKRAENDVERDLRTPSRRSFLRVAAGATGVGLTALTGAADATVVPPVRAVGRDGTELLRGERTKVRTGSGADASGDAGDSATTATVTSLGERVAGRLDGDEEDWYAFDVSSERRLRVELERADEGVAAVSLYDPAGEFLDMMHVDDGSGALEAESNGVGGHLIRVTNVLRGGGPYTVAVATAESDGAPGGEGDSDGAPGGESGQPPTVKRWIEAESANETPGFEPFMVAADDTAAGGAYVQVPDGSGNRPRDPPSDGRAHYEFDLPVDDTYAVWGRVRPDPNDGGDSFRVRIDDDAAVHWEAADESGWSWARLTGGRGVAPVTPRLDAGEHGLTVTWLDDGVDLDRLLVTNDESFEPTGRDGEGDSDGASGDDGRGGGSARPSAAVSQSPKSGKPHAIPTRIEAEEFDEGGEGVAYHDADADNAGGAYRSTGVDVAASEGASGGHSVGWISDGEWAEYTTVVDRGTYDLSVRVAGYARDSRLRVTMGDRELGTVDVPYTGGWETWETATVESVTVERGGVRTLRVEAVGGSFNVDWIALSGRS